MEGVQSCELGLVTCPCAIHRCPYQNIARFTCPYLLKMNYECHNLYNEWSIVLGMFLPESFSCHEGKKILFRAELFDTLPLDHVPLKNCA